MKFLTRMVLLSILGLASGLLLAGGEVKSAVDQPERIIAVGDIHGDYEQLLNILRMAGVIDAANEWIAGKTHLVQLGDLPDRGPDTLKVIRFLQTLEKSAKRNGGRTYFLIGNHEAMNVYGDLRYVTPGEYAAFVTRESDRLQEAHYLDHVEWIKAHRPQPEWPVFDEAYRTAWNVKFPPGYVEHRAAWMPKGELWRWVRGHEAVVKIGDTLFMHGGLGPTYAGWTISELNKAVRTALANEAIPEGTIIRNEEGPLFYRGLALHPETTEGIHVEALLRQFGVRRIVIGHTPTTGAVMTRFNGSVIQADVGLGRFYGSSLACVLIEQGKAYAIHRGQRLLLPGGSRTEQVAYLEQAAALEPDPSRLNKVITALKAEPVAVP